MIHPGGQQQLGNYRLIRRLGSGGFADVFLGEHIHLGRLAAIKVMRSHDSHQGFLNEAKRVAALRHPHIISILDFGIEEEFPYLVMDYAPQGTLRERHPRAQTVPLPTIMTYVRHIASGLQYAHQQKIVHRDVKPENMLLGANGETLLGDFGIAIIAHRIETMTHQTAQGTYTYMAPEQAQGFATPESDQYSLAVVVYEWLCGYPPFFGGTLVDIAVGHAKEPPPSLCQRLPGFPPSLEKIIFKALAKKPQDRFPSVQAFADALEDALQTYKQPTEVVAPPPPISPVAQVVPSPAPVNAPARTPVVQGASSSDNLPLHTTGGTGKGGTRLQDYFNQHSEIIQLALVAEKKAEWQKQQDNNKNTAQGSALDADVWYHKGLLARAHHDIYGAILCWQQGLMFDATYNNGVFVKLIKEDLRNLLPTHLQLLAGRVEQMRRTNQLDEEIRLLEDMQALAPQDQATAEQLFRARQDKEYNWMHQKAKQFLASGDVVLAIEQVNVLQSLASDFRNLPSIKEELMLSLTQSTQEALTKKDLAQAKQQLLHMRRVAPQDRRLKDLERSWCQAMYREADQAIVGEQPISALVHIASLKDIDPNYTGLGNLRQRTYYRSCEVTRRAIEHNDFANAHQRIDEIERNFPAPEQAQYDLPILETQQIAQNSKAASRESQPMTLGQLKTWLPQKHEEYTANQQRALFLQGKQAARRGELAEARRLFQELRQQNPGFTFGNSGTSINQHIEQTITRQAQAAEKARDWQQARAYWQEALSQNARNRRAQRALTIAEQNLRYDPTYQQARQHVEQQQLDQARPLLTEVWRNAPHYGDPARLAAPTGLYSPLLAKKGVIIVASIAAIGALSGIATHILWLGLVVALIIAATCYAITRKNHQGKPLTLLLLGLAGCFLALLLILPLMLS